MPGGIVKQPYFLLEQPQRVTDDTLNLLLGLAVQDPYRPLDLAFRPREPLKARDAIDYLYPDEYVVCTDFTKVEKKAKKGKASSKLQRITALSLEKGNSNTNKLEAAVFRRISMLNSRTKIQDLLSKRRYEDDDNDSINASNPGANEQWTDVGSDKPSESQCADQAPPDPNNDGAGWSWIPSLLRTSAPVPTVPDPETVEAGRRAKEEARRAKQEKNRLKYRKQVLDFLQEQKKLYIITSFITCSEITKNKEKISNTSAQLEAGSGPAGLPSYVTVDLKAGYESTRDAGTSGAYQGEYLIACSYLPLDYMAQKTSFFPSIFGYNKEDAEPYVGAQEIWQLGTGQEGNMASTLGQSESAAVYGDQSTDKEDGSKFQISLVYHPDEKETDPDNSEDELLFEE